MCGYVLADRLRDTAVTVNAVHPGLVATGILGAITPTLAKPLLGLIRPFLLTPAQGAQAALRLATAPELAGITGRYFVRDTEHRSPPLSYDRELSSGPGPQAAPTSAPTGPHNSLGSSSLTSAGTPDLRWPRPPGSVNGVQRLCKAGVEGSSLFVSTTRDLHNISRLRAGLIGELR